MDAEAYSTWFSEYFSSRKQRAKVGNITSNFGSIQRGVPQRSKLAPLLFALYLNDLPPCVPRGKVTMYADDTQVECSAESSCELQLALDTCMKDLQNWMSTNELSINPAKSELLIISRQSREKEVSHVEVTLSWQKPRRSKCCKCLGVMVDDQLQWGNHIDWVCSKAYTLLRGFRRVKSSLPQDLRQRFVGGKFLPLLEYFSVVWDTASANLKAKIDKVFNYSVRLIFDAKFGSPITPLLEDLHWRRLQERRDFRASKVAFKILKRLAPPSLLTILKLNKEVEVRVTDTRTIVTYQDRRVTA